MGYKEGYLAVHFAGCWVEHNCVERFNKYWNMKDRGTDMLRRDQKLRSSHSPSTLT